MKRIDLESLAPGTVTQHEYFTEDGDLLIARGVLLTDRHLDSLKRRNISTLFLKESEEEPSIHSILGADFNAMFENLPLDEENGPLHSGTSGPSSPLPTAASRPQALQLPEFQKIKAGREGLSQLIQSKKSLELDDRLQGGRCSDRPAGVPLKEKIRQIATAERNDEYRSLVLSVYRQSLNRTRTILNTLADGKQLDYFTARGIVEQILRIFMSDIAYLLTIAGLEQTEQDHVCTHSLNVCIFAMGIAANAGYSQTQVIEIGVGALLHDAGMLLIPREIYLKKGKLSQDEWYEIMKHPILGLHLLEKVDRLPEWVPFMAYQCHERENGKGYPKQRSGHLIHNYAKICAIADLYDAFSSPRPYREAYIPYKAMELLFKASKQGLISGELVKSFVRFMSLFPVGSIVELSNRCVGKVIRASPSSPSKPVVSVLFGPDGTRLAGASVYEEDLSANPDVSVVKAHPPRYRGISYTDGL